MSGNHVDNPDWVYNGQYDYLDDKVEAVFSITQLLAHTDTTKTHLYLLTTEVYQMYADVSQVASVPTATTTPVSAPSVIVGYDGRVWQAIDSAKSDWIAGAEIT